MSDTLAITQSLVATQSDATRQAIQTQMIRQQAQAEQGIVDLLQQSASQQKATLAAGQGQAVDIFA